MAPDLCLVDAGAGSLPPGNDTPQLHDRGGGGDGDDDEVWDGEEDHEDGVLQHVEDLGAVQVEPRGHHVVQRDVGLRVKQALHVQLERER